MRAVIWWMVGAAVLGWGSSAGAKELDRKALSAHLDWEQAAWDVLGAADLTGCDGRGGVEIIVGVDGASRVVRWDEPGQATDVAAMSCLEERIAALDLPPPDRARTTFGWVGEHDGAASLGPAITLHTPTPTDTEGASPDAVSHALAQGEPAWQMDVFVTETPGGQDEARDRARLVYYGLLSRALLDFAPTVEGCTEDAPRDASHAYGSWRTRIRVAPSGHIELVEQLVRDLAWEDGAIRPVALTEEQGPTTEFALCLALVLEGERMPRPPGALHVAVEWVRLPRADAATRGGEPSERRLVAARLPGGSRAEDRLADTYVDNVLALRTGRVKRCHSRYQRTRRSDRVSIQASIDVAPDGRVTRVRVAELTDNVASPALLECVALAFESVTFRAPGEEVTLIHPVEIRPRRR